ncbi:MAG: peptidoglycan-binding domain-containing protein [Rubricella sp.]
MRPAGAALLAFSLVGCIDVTLPERNETDLRALVDDQPWTYALGPDDDLLNILQEQNALRAGQGLDPLTEATAIDAVLRARERGEPIPEAILSAAVPVTAAGTRLPPGESAGGQCYARITELSPRDMDGDPIPRREDQRFETLFEDNRLDPMPRARETGFRRVRERITITRPAREWAQCPTVGANTSRSGIAILGTRETATGTLCLLERAGTFETVERQESFGAEDLRGTPGEPLVRQVPRRVLVPTQLGATPGRTIWTPVVCEAAMTEPRIAALQSALAARGLYSGPIDGRMSGETETALRVFQQGLGLDSGLLTVESAGLLGVAD